MNSFNLFDKNHNITRIEKERSLRNHWLFNHCNGTLLSLRRLVFLWSTILLTNKIRGNRLLDDMSVLKMRKGVILVVPVTIPVVIKSGVDVFPQTKETPKTNMKQPTAYDRISRAFDSGEITLKEPVLLKAEHLFAPSLIPVGPKVAPKSDEILVQKDCLTGFYKDVHRVFPELKEEERKFLRSLSPDLEVIF